VIDTHVILAIDNLTEKEKRQKAEINMRLSGKMVHVESVAQDLYAAIDLLMDRLDRQVVKHKTMLRDHTHEAHKRMPEAHMPEGGAAATL
jgi:putative sigma-54 modulation protein